MAKQIFLKSIITCPHCGIKREELMDENSCLFFYSCHGCNMLLKPEPGDCCVFCSYGDFPCPPVQRNTPCSSA